MNADDAVYLQRWIEARDTDGFREIVNRYARLVYAAGYRVLGNAADAEDVAQECFQTLAVAETTPCNYLGPWLHRVATNLALKRIRTDSRRRAREDRFAAERPKTEDIAWDDIYDFVDEAIAALDGKLREPIVAHYLEGYSQTEIAEALGIPRQTITNRIQKGIEEIRTTLRRRGVIVGGTSLGALFAAHFAEASALPKSLVAGLNKLALSGAKGVAGGVAASPFAALLGAKWTASIAASILVAGAALVTFAVVNLPAKEAAAPAGSAPITVSDAQPAPAVETQAVAGDIRNEPGTPIAYVSDTYGPGEVQGVVLDETGAPAVGVAVELTGPPDSYWRKQDKPFIRKWDVTDAEGRFVFDQLPAPHTNIQAPYVVHAYTNDGRASRTVDASPGWGLKEVELNLLPSAAIRGRLVNERGESVSGARIYPRFFDEGKWETWVRVTANVVQSSADGVFEVRHLPMDDYKLMVTSNDYATFESDEIRPGADPVEFVLSRGGSVVGKAVDVTDGSPAPDLTVLVRYREGDSSSLYPWNTAIATTDSDGVYRVDHLRPVPHETLLYHSIEDRYVYPDNGAERPRYEIVEGEETVAPPLDATLGGVLIGRVVDPDTGEGVAGVPVDLHVHGTLAPLPERAHMVTNDQGEFQYSGLPGGEHAVQIGGQTQYRKHVKTSAGEIVDEFEVPYPFHGAISGVVRDAFGNPAPGAIVRVASVSNLNIPPVYTGPDGRFAYTALNPDPDVVVHAFTNHYRSQLEKVDLRSESARTGVIFTLDAPRTASIRGSLVDASGRPISGQQLYVRRTDARHFGVTESTNSDRLGQFGLDRLTAGTYEFGQIGSERVDEPIQVTVAEGEAIESVRVVSAARDSEIAGRVVDRAGNPISQARIYGQGKFEFTNARGEFRITGLEQKAQSFSVDHYEYSSAYIRDVTPNASGIEVVLEPRGAVEGRVARADTGAPVSSFEIVHYKGRMGEPSPRAEWTQVNDADGKFSLIGLDAGEGSIFVRAKGLSPASRVVEVTPGETTSNIEIKLEKGAPVSGTVRNANGDPVTKAVIYLDDVPYHNALEGHLDVVRTNAKGAFTIENVPAETKFLAAFHPDYAVGGTPFVPGDDGVDIVLSRGGEVEGYVFVDGTPVRNGVVSMDTRYQRIRDEIQPDGAFEIKNVSAGEFFLTVTAADERGVQRRISQTVVIEPGATTTTEFNFPNATARIEGTVLERGEPVANAGVLVSIQTAAGRESAFGQTGPGGAYSFEAIPPGVATVTTHVVSSSGAETRVRHVQRELTANQTSRIDINVTGDAAVTGHVEAPEAATSVQVWALTGSVDVEIRGVLDLNKLGDQTAGRVRADADGSFRLTGLEPGGYTLMAFGLDLASAEPRFFGPVFHRATVSENAEPKIELVIR